MLDLLRPLLLNRYLAHKQHLLPGSRADDVVQATRDIVALHATAATGPYLSLWARVPGFQRGMLEDALYEQRTLVKLLCMRVTMHVVPSDEIHLFFQACTGYHERPESRDFAHILVWAGLCDEQEAPKLLDRLQSQVLEVLHERGSATVRAISQAVPELRAKVRHSVGKKYEGEFSVGSRLVPHMAAHGLLIRARRRGTWRSNLAEYALLSDWLPDVDLDTVSPTEARVWLVRRYLAAFGPATADDAQWWTGFTKGETQEALGALASELVEVGVGDLGDDYLMLAEDGERVRAFSPSSRPYVFFLPSLDPYIMGYTDRRRFLAPEHHKKVFDRAGNAAPTVWAGGRVVGVWGQRKDGNVFHELLGPVGDAERALLAEEAQRLEEFLDGEVLPPGIRTPFAHAFA